MQSRSPAARQARGPSSLVSCSRCGGRTTAGSGTETPRLLMLVKRNNKIVGVCAGFASYCGVDVVARPTDEVTIPSVPGRAAGSAHNRTGLGCERCGLEVHAGLK